MPDLGPTLIIRPGALGDAILTLSALRALRVAGAASLTVLGTPASWGFIRSVHEGLRVRDFSSVEWLGLFSDGVALGESARATLAQTRSAVVYLSGDTSGVERVLKQAGVENVLAIEPPLGSVPSRLHAARQLLDPLAEWLPAEALAAGSEVCNQSRDDFLRVDEHELSRALEKLGRGAPPNDPSHYPLPQGERENTFFALHPGSGGRSKCWPADRFAKLAVQISCCERDVNFGGRGRPPHRLTPLVFFGPADEHTRAEFEAAMPAGIEWECADCFSLREVLALLGCARGYVGNDSGITHLAARACPTVALFGPTDPCVWAPLGERVTVLRAPDGSLENLCVDEVLAAAQNVIVRKHLVRET